MNPTNALRRAPVLLAVLLLAAATASAGPGWVRLGPEGGAVSVLAADPSHAGVLLAGLNRGGFYRSEDFGATWSLWARELGADDVWGLAVAADGQRLVARLASGLYLSDDGGGAWRRITLADPDPLFGWKPWLDTVVQAPSDPRVLYATAVASGDTGASIRVLYRSPDRGTTWLRQPLFPPRGACCVTVGATDPDELVARSSEGLHHSLDGGLTWEELRYQGASMPSATPTFSPFRDGWLYAWVARGPLLRSTDHGATWEALPLDDGHSYYGIRLIVPDQGGDTLYAASQGGVLRIAGGEAVWIPVPLPVPSSAVSVLAADPSDRRRLVAASQSGVLRTADGGVSWTPSAAGLNATALEVVFADPGGSGRLFAADTSGLFARDPAGGWTRALEFDRQAPYAPAQAASSPSGVLYLAARGTVSVSRDGGATWEERSEGLPTGDYQWSAGLAVNPRQPADAWAATQSGLFRTLDGGLHWDPVDTGEEARPVSVAVDPNDFRHVLVGLWENPPPWEHAVPVVLSSTDGGATWQRGGIMSSVEAGSFAFPRGSSVVLAATAAGVFRSGDGGLTWAPSSEGMDIQCAWTPGGPDNPGQYECTDSAGSIARDPVRAGTVYASTERGVWRSSDAGASWTLLEPVLGTWGPYAISVAPDGSRLYAATQGTGVLALDLAAYQPPPEDRSVRRRVGRTR